MITILNYSKYQNPKNYESTSDRTNDRTNVEPMLNQGGTDNNKNEKNGENEKNENNYTDSAKRIIAKLNKLANKNFKFGKNNTTNIIARLNEGFTEADCIKVLETKIQDPHFIKSPQYFNPETLFRPSKFEKYLNEDPTAYPKKEGMKTNGFNKEGYYEQASTGKKNDYF